MSISQKTIHAFIQGNQEAIGEVYEEYKNTALDFLKKKKETANSDLIDEMYGETDSYNVMLNLLEPLLTNKETIVTYYKAVFQYTWPEIVELTGIAESTARKIYAEALEKLRKELR